jgi:hypothetical protein
MPYPPPEKASYHDIIEILSKLQVLLRDLPARLPCGDGLSSKYGDFLNFSLDDDILDKTGDEVATLGEQLERVFGWKSRTTGDTIIPIEERGFWYTPKPASRYHLHSWLYSCFYYMKV